VCVVIEVVVVVVVVARRTFDVGRADGQHGGLEEVDVAKLVLGDHTLRHGIDESTSAIQENARVRGGRGGRGLNGKVR
jgi:hypothetical protein